MTDSSDVATADRLGRRRARMLPVLALFFLAQQASFFNNPPGERAVDHVRIGAWAMLSTVLLIALSTKGFWTRSAAVRAIIDDEVTRANRASSMQWGFIAAIAAGIACYVVQGAAQFTAREVIHLIVSAGIVAALVRFGLLERRAYG